MNNLDILKKRLEGIDEEFKGYLDEWKVPGAAIAVIKDNEVIYKKCFGYRDKEEKLPVDENTAFSLASNTKAITSMTCAILVDEGKLEWDKLIINYMPHFKTKDRYVIENITAIDLLTHRTGIPLHDGAFHDISLTRKDIAGLIQHLDFNKGFRTTLQYNNVMYAIAGHLVECIAGVKWEDFVEERIFRPLGMTSSFIRYRKAKEYGNLSKAYYRSNDEIKPMNWFEDLPDDYDYPRGPAGAAISSLNDMITWTKVHLNKGKYDGGQLVSEERIYEMHRPHMMDQLPLQADELGYLSTGLGWFILPYKEHITVSHPGAFGTHINMIEKENLAVIYLPNCQAGISDLFVYAVYDRILDSNIVPWAVRRRKDQKTQAENLKKEKAEEKKKNPRIKDTAPSHELKAYSGMYKHPAYMSFEVKAYGDKLIHSHGNKEYELRHYHYNTFTLIDEDGDERFKVTFNVDMNGRITTLSAPLEPAVDDIVFKKI